MKLKDFDYSLPKELIAQKPLHKMDSSRLMVVSKYKIERKTFSDIADYFSKGDVLVFNDSRVFPAKLIGRKETGGIVKILLIKKINDLLWECLAQGRNFDNKKIIFSNNLCGTIKTSQRDKNQNISFSKNIDKLIFKIGKSPLPPYIKEDASLERYNTVYAETDGSIAAPTAGLHFTPELINKLKNKGVTIVAVTLHVGLGTFLPVKEEKIENHRIHSEFFSISKNSAKKINERKGKLFVVGTTAIRALESSVRNNKVIPAAKETDIFIYPGYKWKLRYGGMITNFHLPKSTLLMLVSAFLSKKRIFELYNEAIKERYKFYSFGDCMLLLQ